MGNWHRRWKLRRIILALDHATNHGLRAGVRNFAQSLEATALMARGSKKAALLTITVEYRDLNEFITYMDKLHCSKLSLLLRARLGLATLAVTDKRILGMTPEELIAQEKPKTKSKNDDNVIQIV